VLNFLTTQQLVLRGDKMAATGRYEKAIALYREALKRRPDKHQLYLHIARISAEAQDYQQAEAALQTALIASPDNPSYHLFLGQIYFDWSRFDDAVQALERCLALQPENQLAQNYQALALYKQGHTREALERLRRHGISHNADFLSRLSLTFEEELLKHPDQFPPPGPEETMSRRTLLWRWFQRTQHLPLLNRLIRFFLIRQYFRRSSRLLYFGNPQGAFELFQLVLQLDPGNKEANFGQGLAYMEMRDYPKAKRKFLELTSLYPDDPLFASYLGLCYYHLGNYRTAATLLKRTSVEGPEDYSTNYYLGLSYLALGQKQEARKYMKIAYEKYYVDTSEECLNRLLERMLTSS
jgi:tetratricopeptide (TPR) repeat protein